jgi:hypothetical protein
VKKVPWVETSATDERTVFPDVDLDRGGSDEEELEDQLRALGYTE